MDIFTEQLVIKPKSTKNTMLKVFSIVAFVILILSILFISLIGGWLSIGLILCIGAIVGCYYWMKQFNVEFEYIITNGDLDIDKIINKEKRKRLLTVNVKDFSAYGSISEMKDSKLDSVLDVSGDDFDKYFAEFKHSKYGNIRLIFTPNEAVLNAIKPFVKVKKY